MKRLANDFLYNLIKDQFIDDVYNLSDLNWKDDTLDTGIGDIDGSDPSMKGYNKGWQMEPYKQRYYANNTCIDRREIMNIKKLSAKEVIDISHSPENYANEILTLWSETDGPLQNFFEAFTMNKIDNKMKKEIANILNSKGYKVYPVLIDERHIHASNFSDFRDLQYSDETLQALEDRLNGQADPINTPYMTSGPNMDFGFDSMTQMNSDIGVPPSSYEVRVSRLKKNL